MELFNSLFLLFFFTTLSLSTQQTHHPKHFKPPLNTSFSLSFPLTSFSLSHSNFLSTKQQNPSSKTSSYSYKSSLKYSMALIVSLPIGTPPQPQQMVLDTGSQLSWIQCNKNKKIPKMSLTPTTSFDPSLSSSFSLLPCNHPLCKPRIPDFTLPTSCDHNRLCHYSYFYADGTYAEGNLVREKITLSNSQSTPPLILGCAQDSGEAEGILGMNLGRFSFASQAKISRFSYCVPIRQNHVNAKSTGTFYFGQNPYAQTFHYVDLLTFDQGQRMPNLDPLAYTVGLAGIKIKGNKLNISVSIFRPDASGVGQTMLDSGTEFTFLVDEAYNKVREAVVRSVGPRLKEGYVYAGALDMCFDGDAVEIRRLIGDMVLEFEKGVEVVIDQGRILADVGDGVHCVGIGQSNLLGVPSNIIGNFHQQNLWVEFDLTNRRVGFGRADCSRSM